MSRATFRWAQAALTCAALIGVATTHANLPDLPPVALEEVLVTGERPGPGMWHVSKDGHDLWVLATYTPLPKKMTWRSLAVEERIAASQIVLAPPRVDADVGFFRGMALLPSLFRARKRADGLTLEQSLPHDLYIRWLALRVKYLGRGNDEHMRPMLAALDLYTHALDVSGLAVDDLVWPSVEQTARKHHVPLQPVTLILKISDAKGLIRQLDNISAAAEVDCLAATVARLETDLEPMRQRANLWSLGDVAGLHAAQYPQDQVACLNAFDSVPEFRERMVDAKQRLTDAWLAAAAGAIAKNQSSFAVLSLTEMLKPDGWLAKLRAQGYRIEDPR